MRADNPIDAVHPDLPIPAGGRGPARHGARVRAGLVLSLLAASGLGWRPAAGQETDGGSEGSAGGDGSDDDDSSEEGERRGDDEEAPDRAGRPAPEVEESLEVVAPREARTPAERSVDRAVLGSLPVRSADELLQVVPGLLLSQHGGRGKAQQYLTRGFDAAHGSDVAVFLEGIPLNEVSNVHGQGYLDLGIVSPDLVRRIDVVKGPHRSDRGDFAVAASGDLQAGLDEPGLGVRVQGSTAAEIEGQVRFRPLRGSPGSFALLEGGFERGVGEDREAHRLRVGLGAEGRIGRARGRLLVLGHDGAFESPGVLRQDDLDAGRVSFYDSHGTGSGGETRRLLAAALIAADGPHWDARARIWGGARHLRLASDFTGFARDPAHGDARSQRQRAVSGGAGLVVRRSFSLLGDLSSVGGGLDLRFDRIHQVQEGVDRDGVAHETQIEAEGTQGDGAAFAEGELGVAGVVRIAAGVRFDLLVFHVESAEGGRLDEIRPAPARSRAFVVSPRASLRVRPFRPFDLFAAWGRGFRSPEARGVVDGQTAPVTRSDTLDVGARLALPGVLDLRAGAFAVWLQDELVFDHAAGRFLLSGSTRRVGFEASAALLPVRSLRIDVDLTWADGRFVVTGEPIPYAPRWMGVVGIGACDVALPSRGGRRVRLDAGLRARWTGPRPLPEDFVSHGFVVVDASAAVAFGDRPRSRLLLDIQNVLGLRWRDGEFVYPSWFDTSRPHSLLPALHVTAGTPFTLRAGLEVLL